MLVLESVLIAVVVVVIVVVVAMVWVIVQLPDRCIRMYIYRIVPIHAYASHSGAYIEG